MRRAITGLLVALAVLAFAPISTASAQSYLPNNNQWAAATIYQGATLVLAYDAGNASRFSPEQVALFNLTSGWLAGAGQALATMALLDQTPHGGRCSMHLRRLTLADIARKYADYWMTHPEVHDTAAMGILINAIYGGHPCN